MAAGERELLVNFEDLVMLSTDLLWSGERLGNWAQGTNNLERRAQMD